MLNSTLLKQKHIFLRAIILIAMVVIAACSSESTPANQPANDASSEESLFALDGPRHWTTGIPGLFTATKPADGRGQNSTVKWSVTENSPSRDEIADVPHIESSNSGNEGTAHITFPEDGNFTVKAWFENEDGDRISGDLEKEVNTHSELFARLDCKQENGAVLLEVYLDTGNRDDWPRCRFEIAGGRSGYIVELLSDNETIFEGVATTADGVLKLDSKVEPGTRLDPEIIIPPHPPGGSSLRLVVHDARLDAVHTGEDFSVAFKWDDPELSVDFVQPETGNEIAAGQSVRYLIGFRDNVDISTKGDLEVGWFLNDEFLEEHQTSYFAGSDEIVLELEPGEHTLEARLFDPEFFRNGAAFITVNVGEPGDGSEVATGPDDEGPGKPVSGDGTLFPGLTDGTLLDPAQLVAGPVQMFALLPGITSDSTLEWSAFDPSRPDDLTQPSQIANRVYTNCPWFEDTGCSRAPFRFNEHGLKVINLRVTAPDGSVTEHTVEIIVSAALTVEAYVQEEALPTQEVQFVGRAIGGGADPEFDWGIVGADKTPDRISESEPCVAVPELELEEFIEESGLGCVQQIATFIFADEGRRTGFLTVTSGEVEEEVFPRVNVTPFWGVIEIQVVRFEVAMCGVGATEVEVPTDHFSLFRAGDMESMQGWIDTMLESYMPTDWSGDCFARSKVQNSSGFFVIEQVSPAEAEEWLDELQADTTADGSGRRGNNGWWVIDHPDDGDLIAFTREEICSSSPITCG